MKRNKGARRIHRKKPAGKLSRVELQRIWYYIDCGCMVKSNLPVNVMQAALGGC